MLPTDLHQLKKQLLLPLPGAIAHQLMAPAHRLSSPEYLSKISDYKKGSVLILLYEQANTIHFVLTLRQSYPGVHSGQVSLPGGKIEAFDNSPIAAALRETQEEIGINANEIEVLGELSPLYIFPSNFLVHPVVGFLNSSPIFKKEEKEVAEIIEVPLPFLLDAKKRKTKLMDLSRGLKAPDLTAVEVPYYDIHGHHVWGATAMILSEFLELMNLG